MRASRSPRGRKSRAARRIAWSKSGCSTSFMASASLRLPVGSVGKARKGSETEPRQRIQIRSQRGESLLGFAELLANGAQHGSNTWRLGRSSFEQALETSRLPKIPQHLFDRLIR